MDEQFEVSPTLKDSGSFRTHIPTTLCPMLLFRCYGSSSAKAWTLAWRRRLLWAWGIVQSWQLSHGSCESLPYLSLKLGFAKIPSFPSYVDVVVPVHRSLMSRRCTPQRRESSIDIYELSFPSISFSISSSSRLIGSLSSFIYCKQCLWQLSSCLTLQLPSPHSSGVFSRCLLRGLFSPAMLFYPRRSTSDIP